MCMRFTALPRIPGRRSVPRTSTPRDNPSLPWAGKASAPGIVPCKSRGGERGGLQNEKLSLGFYLSGHPFNAYRDELRRFARTPLANLQPSLEPAMMAGVIYGVQMRNSRRGRIAILTLDDGTARVEVVV